RLTLGGESTALFSGLLLSHRYTFPRPSCRSWVSQEIVVRGIVGNHNSLISCKAPEERKQAPLPKAQMFQMNERVISPPELQTRIAICRQLTFLSGRTDSIEPNNSRLERKQI